ncbi:hypothetical protein C2H96_18020 [Bacillus subtilis]|nr:hypothetical protein CJ480_19170 [Bacillus subtilis]UQZ56246.1 hypothetical protein C2H96_18020 [Bacillus subtilis]UQZ65379.1 hypothetical protein C2H97_02280 [Bacillus subtilis PY79]UQZ69805.1 hypothetical protein C2I05_04265 [Bacillus subtilis]
MLILNRARAPGLHAGALFQVLKQLRQGMVKYMTVKRRCDLMLRTILMIIGAIVVIGAIIRFVF